MKASDNISRVVFAGGDARMMYAAERVASGGICPRLCVSDTEAAKKRLAAAGFDSIETAKRNEVLADCTHLVLGLPVSRDGEHIWDPIIGEEPTVWEIFSQLSPGTRVLCGMANACVKTAAMESRTLLTDYYCDEAFLIQNAAMTAEGALSELIRLYPGTLLGSRCVIFGYGRCASALARRLTVLGCSVTVIARSAEKRASAIADGAAAVEPEKAADHCRSADFAVNTVPAAVIGVREAASLAQNGAFVLELADRSGLSDGAQELVRVIRAAGLPGRFSPASAGGLIAERVMACLNE